MLGARIKNAFQSGFKFFLRPGDGAQFGGASLISVPDPPITTYRNRCVPSPADTTWLAFSSPHQLISSEIHQLPISHPCSSLQCIKHLEGSNDSNSTFLKFEYDQGKQQTRKLPNPNSEVCCGKGWFVVGLGGWCWFRLRNQSQQH